MDRLLPVSFVICLFLVIGLSDAVNERLRIQKITEAVRPTIAPRPPLPHEPERCDSRILIGMPGASGPAGSQGMPGVQGPSGFPGASGNNGINGSPGPDGLRGPKGDAGAPGETGEQGLDGLQGFSGPAGERGVSGPIGNPGLTGPSGVNGPDGYKGDPGYPGESGIAGRPGRKGDPGVPGLEGECSCPIPYYDGPRGRRTPVRPVPVLPPSRGAKSAFSAARTTDLQATDGAVTVTYQKVFSNQGNHFNKDTGVFRCAIAGTYFFTMSIYKSSAEGFPLVQLLHNQRPVIAVVDHESADATDTATNSVVLDLAVGDQVSLELKGGWELASNENRLTTFSGFLLFEA